MNDQGRFNARRTRAIVGASVIGVALAAAGVLGGVGLARNSVSAAQSQYGKITICHRTHSKKKPGVTITVSLAAWPAHQRHGYTIGACVTTTTTTGTTSTTTGETTTTAAAASTGPGKSGQHGNGNGNGHSHGHGH